MKIFVVLLTFIGYCMAVTCPNVPAKNVTNMPSLDPIQFSYKIQITVEDLNKTLDGFEYYDFENQTIFYYLDQKNGSVRSRKKFMFDYKYNQTFLVDEMTESCKVHDLNSSLPHHLSLFGENVENGPEAVTYAFHWNGTYNSTYQGTEKIDGIDTDHYHTCLSFDGGNVVYLVDVYFSTVNWSMPSGQPAPVLLKLNATIGDTTPPRVYIYKFSDYHDSTLKSQHLPSRPHGVICHNRKDAPAMSNFSGDNFKSAFDVSDFALHRVFSYKEYFSYANKVVRFDWNDPLDEKNAFSRIQDFNLGLLFLKNITTGDCKISNITSNSAFDFDVTYDENNSSLVRLKHPQEDINAMNLTYGGMDQFKGISAHLWIAQNPLVMLDYMKKGQNLYIFQAIYMSTEKWNLTPLPIGIQQRIVVGSSPDSPHSSMQTLDVIDGSTGLIDHLDVFDYSDCYEVELRQTVILKFNSENLAEIEENPTIFQRAMHSAVARYAGVTELRVSPNLPYSLDSHMIPRNDSSDSANLYVWVTLLGIPDVKGNSIYMKKQPDLKTIVVKLKDVVSSNSFIVTFESSAGEKKTLTAFSDYWMTVENLLNPPPPPVNPTPATVTTGVTTGVVVGVAIATFIGGLLVAFLIMMWRGRRGRSGFAYSMQE